MEVSSHALDQSRSFGTAWDAAVFTNITRDHLDYHKSFEAYQQAKCRLFSAELRASNKARKFAIINADDPAAEVIAAAAAANAELIYCSAKADRRSQARLISYRGDTSGTKVEIDVFGKRIKIDAQLVGEYNALNILTAAATLAAVGKFSNEEISRALSEVAPVPGRLELVGQSKIRVYVDYAHTPDALERAQGSLRGITAGRLITVFGCGGDRDRGKRPLMGEAVARFSDYAVVTSDNPRTEPPEKIIEDIIPGVDGVRRERSKFLYSVDADRRSAIKRAIEEARPGDAVLIAGKGHEDYQEIHGKKYPFSDVVVSREILHELELL